MSSKAFLWFRALLFTFLVPGVVLGLVPGFMVSDGHGHVPAGPGLPELVGLIVAGAGAALYAACLRLFVAVGRGTPAPVDPPRAFVAVGPYRFVRNPMYIGAVAIVVGEAVFFRSVTLGAYAAVLAFAFHLFVVGYEEPGLRTRFGDSYETYRARVPRWWPRRPVE